MQLISSIEIEIAQLCYFKDSGTKANAKRWATPYCSLPNEEAGPIFKHKGVHNGKGLAEILNDFPQQEQRFMAFPVYAKEVKRLNNMPKLISDYGLN
jgi:hypothetical protein